ncbi:hypothetical protein NDU88_003202 [Pleurodeles waltl]|uniref:Uncharacterized protein n=1 Tax=Pleurodeles waltl TaxID=8319 RepID=A0AAV7VGP2_PLEWA|nr:hypothetical protein NDU88_003202 [Pleurodeles waltl]
MAVLCATLPAATPLRQLENTLEKHITMFDKALHAIPDPKTAKEMQLGAIQIERGLLWADYAKLTYHVDSAESKLASIEPTVETAGSSEDSSEGGA